MSPARCLSPTLKAEVQVNTVIERSAGALKPGDVYVLNDPYDGGTHLPDVTVATPVFADLPSPSVNAVAGAVQAADAFGIETPGGGGFGAKTHDLRLLCAVGN